MTEKQRIPPQEVYRWEHIHWFRLRPSLRFSRWGARWRPDLSSSPLSSKQYQTWREQTHFIHQHTFMKNSPLFTTPEKNRSGVFFSLAPDKGPRHETVVLTCFSPPLRRCRYSGRRWTSDPVEKIERGYVAANQVRIESSPALLDHTPKQRLWNIKNLLHVEYKIYTVKTSNKWSYFSILICMPTWSINKNA